MNAVRFLDALRQFTLAGEPTAEFEDAGLRYFVNEYWTAGQRRGHSLHEISYRACFKAQLPEFLIERLTVAGQVVYDPFSGRGTTALQAALMKRRPVANDINPLSAMLLAPRLCPPVLGGPALGGPALGGPALGALRDRLDAIPPVDEAFADEPELDAFYHRDTLRRIRGLRRWLLERAADGQLDPADSWIRMVALNRLTGHSPGFFSVYTLPPNQAASVGSQRKINATRGQIPPPRDVGAIILKKTKSLLSDGLPPAHPSALLMTGAASATPALGDAAVDLLVTSPPFLDIVDYEGDNWLRCWFAGIDPRTVQIARHRDIPAWEGFVRDCFTEFARVVRPGGFIGFEVGEVRGGKVLLERHVLTAIAGLPFEVLGVMVNQQAFTKTANCWGVGNNKAGTNTNRIVLVRRR